MCTGRREVKTLTFEFSESYQEIRHSHATTFLSSGIKCSEEVIAPP